MPGDDAGPRDEVLAALVASLCAELAESQAALARAVGELTQARERIGELEARLRQTPRNSSKPVPRQNSRTDSELAFPVLVRPLSGTR